MSKLERLKTLPGAKASVKEKPAPTATDLGQLVKELQSITMAQQSSEESITKAINQLSKVVLMASEDGFNMTEIVNAINGLKDMMAEKHRAPFDYEIDFERDQRTGLMKPGIRLSAVPKRLDS